AGAGAGGQDHRIGTLFVADHAQRGAHVGSGETLDSHIGKPGRLALGVACPLPARPGPEPWKPRVGTLAPAGAPQRRRADAAVRAPRCPVIPLAGPRGTKPSPPRGS